MLKSWLLPILAGCTLAGCYHAPHGPSVMALPGRNKDFDQFRYDDGVCRQFAAEQIGITPARAANDTAVANAALGTVVGAAAGAAIGAATGSPATGAAVGAGSGLLGGTLLGAGNAEAARYDAQQRYDMAYLQCMYAKGNQIPVPGGAIRRSARAYDDYDRPPPPPRPRNVPAPPRGEPPLPPPGY